MLGADGRPFVHMTQQDQVRSMFVGVYLSTVAQMAGAQSGNRTLNESDIERITSSASMVAQTAMKKLGFDIQLGGGENSNDE